MNYETVKTKNEWLVEFRELAERTLEQIKSEKNYKEKAKKLNQRISNYKEEKISEISFLYHNNKSDCNLLNTILMITYASYVVMLEARNTVWPYEYMAFSRRIGELWEPFCKLPFYYPVNKLNLIPPPDFDAVQKTLKQRAKCFFDCLNVTDKEKNTIKEYYDIPWTFVDSGGIKLDLDLHFEQGGVNYNCDFKSGFSSNEKGNTNRLLLVGSIYGSLNDAEKNILFVRQKEDENNHYLLTLKNSPYWQVYCADESYEEMQRFSGFDIKKWINDNINWQSDISDDFRKHLKNENLLKYLTW